MNPDITHSSQQQPFKNHSRFLWVGLKIIRLTSFFKLHKMSDPHRRHTSGWKRTMDLWENIESMPLKGCESPQPRKRDGKWVLSSHPAKQRGCSRPLPRASSVPPLHHEPGSSVMCCQEQEAECICPATPLKPCLGPTPNPWDVTITVIAIVRSMSPLFQEMPQASLKVSD